MAVFNGELYVGTYNRNDGAEIQRYNKADDTWTRVASVCLHLSRRDFVFAYIRYRVFTLGEEYCSQY
jgi:hypothetical protein